MPDMTRIGAFPAPYEFTTNSDVGTENDIRFIRLARLFYFGKRLRAWRRLGELRQLRKLGRARSSRGPVPEGGGCGIEVGTSVLATPKRVASLGKRSRRLSSSAWACALWPWALKKSASFSPSRMRSMGWISASAARWYSRSANLSAFNSSSKSPRPSCATGPAPGRLTSSTSRDGSPGITPCS